MRLEHSERRWLLALATSPIGSMFAAIRVCPACAEKSLDKEEATSGHSRGQKEEEQCMPGGTMCHKAQLPSSLDMEEATRSQSGGPCADVAIGVKSARLWPPYVQLLEWYPAVVNPSKKLPPVCHHMQHVIETEGWPMTSRYRRLDPAHLAAAH